MIGNSAFDYWQLEGNVSGAGAILRVPFIYGPGLLGIGRGLTLSVSDSFFHGLPFF